MPKERLVFIGGDTAEMNVASQARRWRPELDLLVFERSPHMSYSACGIPYYVGDVLRKVEAFL